MTEDQLISLVEWHHIEYHATGGTTEHWNLEPLIVKDHKERTAKIDTPQIAKTKRISRSQEEFRQRMLTPREERSPKRSRWASRPFPKRRKSR